MIACLTDMKTPKWYLSTALCLMIVAMTAVEELQAQVIVRGGRSSLDPLPAYVEYPSGDTVAIVLLRETYCFNRKKFRSADHQQDYWRMVRDVKKTLPIAKAARRLLVQAYDTIQYIPSEREQRKYFKKLEEELWVEWKPQLKRLNYRQGKLLVRLIDRECDKKVYQLIREFLGSRKAFFWQSFGKLFGVSLKSEWDPNGKDKELEDICIQVEQGLI